MTCRQIRGTPVDISITHTLHPMLPDQSTPTRATYELREIRHMYQVACTRSGSPCQECLLASETCIQLFRSLCPHKARVRVCIQLSAAEPHDATS
eukprot:1158307-Pelagomonas_calceolata.AAC.4